MTRLTLTLPAALLLTACGAPFPGSVVPSDMPPPETCTGWAETRADLVEREAFLARAQTGNALVDRAFPLLVIGGPIDGRGGNAIVLADIRGEIVAGDRECGG